MVRVALIAPGLAPLPPAPATSVEIYLYDLWRHLPARVDASLYARKQVVMRHGSLRSQMALPEAGGLNYVREVMRHVQARSHRDLVIQVDNRPLYLPIVKNQVSCPLLLSLHSLTFVQRPKASTEQMHSALALADRIIVNSHYVANRLSDSFSSCASRIRVVYPGVDTQSFHPCETSADFANRREWRARLSSRDRTVLLFVGRIVERKGLHIALQALRQISAKRGHANVVLWIVGRRPPVTSRYGQQLAALARAENVRWLGYTLRGDLPALYRAADVLLCPSQKAEAFGLVNLEAQASGVPVIASHAWGLSESVVDGKTGVLVDEYEDSSKWAKVAYDLCQDGHARHALSLSAVKMMKERFSWPTTAARFAQLYEDRLH